MISFSNAKDEEMGGIIEINVIVPQILCQLVDSSDPLLDITWRVSIFLLERVSVS